MRLASVFFSPPLPIPGTGRHESSLHAADGWDLFRQEDGRIVFWRNEPGDNGQVRRVGGTVERWGVVYGGTLEPEVEVLPNPYSCVEVTRTLATDREAGMRVDVSAPTEPAPETKPEPPTGKRRRGR
jgi:hypothetical protein